jgi:hypothetical protein
LFSFSFIFCCCLFCNSRTCMYEFSIPTGTIELYAHEIYRSRIYKDLRKIEDGNSQHISISADCYFCVLAL